MFLVVDQGPRRHRPDFYRLAPAEAVRCSRMPSHRAKRCCRSSAVPPIFAIARSSDAAPPAAAPRASETGAKSSRPETRMQNAAAAPAREAMIRLGMPENRRPECLTTNTSADLLSATKSPSSTAIFTVILGRFTHLFSEQSLSHPQARSDGRNDDAKSRRKAPRGRAERELRE